MNDSPIEYKQSLLDRIRCKWLSFKYFMQLNIKYRLIRFLGGVPADFTCGYHSHARRELPGLKPGANEMDVLMANQLLELLAVFSTHGHSGFSAPWAISMFSKLAKHEPLGPLTGESDEWGDVSESSGKAPGTYWQNIRASHVFKDEDGRAYDINGKIFRDPDGCTYTNRDSRVYIEFPYTPKTEIVDVDHS